MKIFAIRDETDISLRDLAYLIYYEKEKRFYIELPDDADPWETPLLLSSFLKRGERTVNAYWSKVWVRQRIVPQDRQNLGSVLKENRLKDYDEFSLLMLAHGRCAQDDYYLTSIDNGTLQEKLRERYQKRIETVTPLAGLDVLVFFRDGSLRKIDLRPLLKVDRKFKPILHQTELFTTVRVQVGGYGITWGEDLDIADTALYQAGQPVPLCQEDFAAYIANNLITTAEAAELMGCSRQNVNDLVSRGVLQPVKTSAKSKLFLKSDVLLRKVTVNEKI